MEKFFNIAGPCNPARHYMLPPTERLPEVMRLVERDQYFAIHAARQSGKTTLLKGLVRDINASGERGKRLKFDAAAFRYTNDDEANKLLKARPYLNGWSLDDVRV